MEVGPSQSGSRWMEKMRECLKIITIEPAIFLQTFTWGLGSVIGQNLLIAKQCHDLGYDSAVCGDIENHPSVEDEVETKVSELNMIMNMLSALPCIVVALFIGPWSDKNGRKPVMLLPMLGYILSTLYYLLNIYYFNWPAKYLLVNGVFSIFGGFVSFLIGIYAFLADITSTRSRTTRIGLLDIFLYAGVPAGTFLSAYIFKAAGYFGIYGTTLALQIFVCFYIAFFITDTRGPHSNFSYPNSELDITRSCVRRFISIINIQQLLDVFRVTFKKRRNNLRAVILVLVTLMLLNVTTFSDGGVLYLYARKKFHWDEQMYTKFQTCTIVVSAVAAFLVMPLVSFYWKVHDAAVGLLASCSKIVSLVIISIAWNGWVLFAGSCAGFLSAFSAIVIRSMLSKCVSKAELGKIFSLLASLEGAVPLFASPLFTFVYTHTLESWTGAVFIVQAAIFLLAELGFLYVYFVLRRAGGDFSTLLEEEGDDTTSLLREEYTEQVENERESAAVVTRENICDDI